MKSILDLFGSFSRNEAKLNAIDEYLKIITPILIKDQAFRSQLSRDLKNNIRSLENQGEEDVAFELSKFLGRLNEE